MKVKASSLAVAATLVALPLLAREPTRVAPDGAPSSADVVPPGAPGERLEVSGVVYAADGRTPSARPRVYVYQTDARGYLPDRRRDGQPEPRLMALLRTDGRGRYSYRTIRPGSYPGTRVPQHIHYEVTAERHGTRIFEIAFEDDPFVSAQVRADAARPGSFYSLQPVRKGPAGVGRLTQDVVLPER